jgi:hypothetical protein
MPFNRDFFFAENTLRQFHIELAQSLPEGSDFLFNSPYAEHSEGTLS